MGRGGPVNARGGMGPNIGAQ